MAARIVILTEGHTDPVTAKTAACVIRYRTDDVVAILDKTQEGRTSGELLDVGGDIPVVGSLEAVPEANTLMIGIAPSGGRIPDAWRPAVLAAISRGMDVVSGLHDFLADDAEFAAAAERHNVRLVDVRRSDERDVTQREGIRPDCLRIETVGNDCSVGKMVAAVEIARGLSQRGCDVKFVATGQTGILVEGDGCAVDCVVADFVGGAAERLVLTNQHHDVLVIEGQGSLAHPKYSGVTLSLLHGTMPHGLIFCYEAGRTALHGMEHVGISPMRDVLRLYKAATDISFPAKVIGMAVNGRRLSDVQLAAEKARIRTEFGLPICDIFRDGPDELVEAVLGLKSEQAT